MYNGRNFFRRTIFIDSIYRYLRDRIGNNEPRKFVFFIASNSENLKNPFYIYYMLLLFGLFLKTATL